MIFCFIFQAVGSIVVLVICLAATSLSLVLFFRTPVQATVDESEKSLPSDNDNSKTTDIMDVAISMEISKELPTDKNLIDSAGIAIYKMTKSDSGKRFGEILFVLNPFSHATDIVTRSDTTPVGNEVTKYLIMLFATKGKIRNVSVNLDYVDKQEKNLNPYYIQNEK